jgi:serine protease Do
MKKNNIAVLLVVTILISFLCGSFIAYAITFNTSNNKITSRSNNSIIPLTESNSITDAISKVYDSTVVIEGFKDNKLISTGTGFIYKQIDDDSYIMTNHHVINECDNIKVVLSDSSEAYATIKGSEIYSDIAVLSIKNNDSTTIAKLGNSEDLRVGDTLFTVGSPEGADYAGTVTKGILSGKDRLVAVALSNSNTSDYYMKVLQTDAAINPGNSGGPICNINGEVIGITNMKLVDNSVEGMGFAIPIEDALYYAAIFEKGENVVRPYIGVSMLDVTDDYYLWQNGLNIPNNIKEGVVILEVVDDSPAAKAGLQKGDIITTLEENKISSLAEFRYELYKHEVGETLKIKYYRNNKENTTKIILTQNSN